EDAVHGSGACAQSDAPAVSHFRLGGTKAVVAADHVRPSLTIGLSGRQFHERRLPMKQPIRILGICLLMLAANLVAQALGPNSPPLVHPSAAPMVTVSCAGSECLLCRRLHGRSLVSQNSLSRMAK